MASLSERDLAAAALSLATVKIEEAQDITRRWSLVAKAYGEGLADWTIAENRSHSAADAAMASWGESSPTLVIAGPPGHGKSVTCAAWGGRMGAHMVRASDVDAWPWGGGEAASKLRNADALVVDDLGREDPRSQGLEVMINALAARHDAGRRTIVSAMIGRNSAGERYAGHWLDRVGRWWLGLRDVGSMRECTEVPQTRALARARQLLGLAERAMLVQAGTLEDPQAARRMARLLEFPAGAVTSRAVEAERARQETHALGAELVTQWRDQLAAAKAVES